jgi:hypothetical protein
VRPGQIALILFLHDCYWGELHDGVFGTGKKLEIGILGKGDAEQERGEVLGADDAAD